MQAKLAHKHSNITHMYMYVSLYKIYIYTHACMHAGTLYIKLDFGPYLLVCRCTHAHSVQTLQSQDWKLHCYTAS